MAEPTPERVPYESAAVTADQLERLKELFPTCVRDGKLDFEHLRALLDETEIVAGPDRYSFTWAGRAEAFRAIQTPSSAALRPDREASISFDAARHVFVEGENLEVLKLLYKAYFGKAKLIYIDPPYNTGRERIYRDDYSEPRRAYLEKTGQVDAEGNVLTSNPEASGRYHSDWLSMMYPRLFVARQLLREDGAIFVSIDDHEVHNLRLVMNEIFGEENFVATVIWHKIFSPKNTANYFSEDHDYIVIYARDKEGWRPNLLPRTEDADARYTNPDNDPRGPWTSSDLTARNPYSAGKYEVVSPSGRRFEPARGRYWGLDKRKFEELDNDNRIWWGEKRSSMPRVKRFLSEVQQGIVPQTLWHYDDVGHTQEAKKELKRYIGFEETENVLDSVKPTRLLQRVLQIATEPDGDDLVLDFFAGSAPLVHAVMTQNADDGGNRRSISVQIAEPLPQPEARLKTVTDLGLTRLRAVIAEMGEERADDDRDNALGLKVFRLAPTSYRQAKPNEHDEEASDQLVLFEGGLRDDAKKEHVLYEVLLKLGYSLNSTIEKLDLDSNEVYRITDEIVGESPSKRSFRICLDRDLRDETIETLDLAEGDVFVCLDSALTDSQKLNLTLQCRLKVI